MIVKILKSSYSFDGLSYNERKVEEGKAQLLHAANFEGLLSPVEQVSLPVKQRYLEMISELNPRVKRKQFHAILSTKGTGHSFSELTQLGIAYLQGMGYGKNPYLIYGHQDTAHRHIHMVSTRVGPDGKKVNDSYEKKRSVELIAQLLEKDLTREHHAVLSQVMSYQFSTTAQLGLLLEQQGYRLRKHSDHYEIIKYGSVQARLDPQRVESHLRGYMPWPQRSRELQKLLSGMKGASLDYVSNTMKEHQVDVIFHRAKSHPEPYGYTVIDHPYKQVFKGSSLVPLRQFLGKETSRTLENTSELRASKSNKLPFFEVASGEEESPVKKNKKNSLKRKR